MKKFLIVIMTLMGLMFITSGCQSSDYGVDKNDHGSKHEEVKKPDKQENPPVKQVEISQNDAFIVTSPYQNQTVEDTFVVEGKARVFEATFQYRLEDGHNILAEGTVMANMGAPEWGNFKFEITHKKATSPNGVLIIYEASAKDGAPIHELMIPVTFSSYE